MSYGVPYPATPADTDLQENENTPVLDTTEPLIPDEAVGLFPEPEIQKLLHEIAGDLDEVDQFVSKMNKELAAEQAPKPRFTPERRKRFFK